MSAFGAKRGGVILTAGTPPLSERRPQYIWYALGSSLANRVPGGATLPLSGGTVTDGNYTGSGIKADDDDLFIDNDINWIYARTRWTGSEWFYSDSRRYGLFCKQRSSAACVFSLNLGKNSNNWTQFARRTASLSSTSTFWSKNIQSCCGVGDTGYVVHDGFYQHNFNTNAYIMGVSDAEAAPLITTEGTGAWVTLNPYPIRFLSSGTNANAPLSNNPNSSLYQLIECAFGTGQEYSLEDMETIRTLGLKEAFGL